MRDLRLLAEVVHLVAFVALAGAFLLQRVREIRAALARSGARLVAHGLHGDDAGGWLALAGAALGSGLGVLASGARPDLTGFAFEALVVGFGAAAAVALAGRRPGAAVPLALVVGLLGGLTA